MCNVMEMTKLRRENEALKAKLALFQTPCIERPSPRGVIEFDQVEFLAGKVVIKYPSLVCMLPTGSDSMDPLLDLGDIVIGTEDFDKDSLVVGDIVVYYYGGTIPAVHRIDSITLDMQGRLYRLLGDNNGGNLDPYLVRNDHIKYLVVGILYIKKTVALNGTPI